MNIELIKQKLSALQTRGGQGKSKIAENVWKAPIGKHQVRILPAKWNKENPFKELFFHYGIGNRTMISLINFGEKDPIVEFSQSLKNQTYTLENYKMAKKLEPKMRVFVPVIVRGQEDKGVKLWEFGKEVYLELCALAEDEDVGDYTDTFQGRDLIVETVGPDQSGRQFNKTSVRIKTKTTPASDDAKQLKLWLENQLDPIELYKKYTYEELKQALFEWLNPAEPTTVSEEEDETDDKIPHIPLPGEEGAVEEIKPAKKYTLKTPKKENIDKELDDLFKD